MSSPPSRYYQVRKVMGMGGLVNRSAVLSIRLTDCDHLHQTSEAAVQCGRRVRKVRERLGFSNKGVMIVVTEDRGESWRWCGPRTAERMSHG